MILNRTYYQEIWNRFENIGTLSNDFNSKAVNLTVKVILEHYQKKQPLHINFQNSKESILEIAKYLFVEFANDIYLNHYDLPEIKSGDKLKRTCDNEYYIAKKLSNSKYYLVHQPRKSKNEKTPTNIPEISYDRLVKNFVKVDSGISEKTIKNYFEYFEKLNSKKSDFPITRFEQKIVFISKKTFWDSLTNKNKIPSTYLPNPREENHLSEIRSIPALSNSIIYCTPKYETCYQKLLLMKHNIKTIVVFDTEANKIEQILQDKLKYGFNLIILSNSFSPLKNPLIPCWNWFNEEIEIINSLYD